jgi:DNA-binding transcriptional LysR family regulator
MQINVEIRLQAAALTLAEELNFTPAAERLRITQPALSKQIIELESRLDFPVFIRGQKRVELTDAGQVSSPTCGTRAPIPRPTSTCRNCPTACNKW